jgi:hypothetical protein
MAQAACGTNVNFISKYWSGCVNCLIAFWSVVNWEYMVQRVGNGLVGKVQFWPVTQKFSHSVR